MKREHFVNTNLQPNSASKHRTCAMAKRKKAEANPDILKGWQQIAAFLGQPVSVAQRWATEGMPVRKQGRYVESSGEELNRWLGRESAGEPVQIATKDTDLLRHSASRLLLTQRYSTATLGSINSRLVLF